MASAIIKGVLVSSDKDLYNIKGFTNIIKCYGGYGDWSSGYTPDATFGSS